MKTSSRIKTALLAAVSLTAASVAVAHAANPAPVEPVTIEHAVQSADQDALNATERPGAVKGWALGGLLAAALAGIARLIGFRKIGAAATSTARVAGDAAKAVVRAASSPLRFVLLIAGLALVAFAGVGFYDLEWTAGLILGAFIAATVLLGARRMQKSLAIGQSRRVH